MKIMIVAVALALLAIAGFVVASSFNEASESEEVLLPACGSETCDGGCTAGNSCGSPTCGASQGKTCGCGLR